MTQLLHCKVPDGLSIEPTHSPMEAHAMDAQHLVAGRWQNVSPSAPRQLYVAFKVAEVCNLACGYCYFFEQADQSHSTAPRYMSDTVVEQSARFLGLGAKALGIPNVALALHGGEPLMLGKKRFDRVCEILKAGVTPHATLRLAVQTNGVLLDQEWIELFAHHDIAIGLSIDGSREIHDAARPDKKGRGSFDRVVKALRLLQENESRGTIKKFGILSVIDPAMSCDDVYDFFFRELGAKSLYQRAPNLNWADSSESTIAHVNHFMAAMFNRWAYEDDAVVQIRHNIEALHPLLHDEGAFARVTNILDLTQAISIRSNGDVCPDDSLPPVSMRYRQLGTNVTNCSLETFYSLPIWNEINEALGENGSECRTCEWFGLCGGGPAVTRYHEEDKFSKRSVFCAGYKRLYEASREYVEQYLDPSDVRARMRLASETLTRHADALNAGTPLSSDTDRASSVPSAAILTHSSLLHA
ncbi:radical SAM protein [Sphingomonas pokkalii]|uniref:Radical SAM core domain-containing protein n=1 Tax=Sphingomonas pokkalii TaxID=2175090 RepID=A0A2U0SBW1_9SPHN|nr:radical SAM protein [Sphingomonas pokkalii]PVX28853.1 hypothetical protein DD559_05510 [Sphingomonas pokkalii]